MGLYLRLYKDEHYYDVRHIKILHKTNFVFKCLSYGKQRACLQ